MATHHTPDDEAADGGGSTAHGGPRWDRLASCGWVAAVIVGALILLSFAGTILVDGDCTWDDTETGCTSMDWTVGLAGIAVMLVAIPSLMILACISAFLFVVDVLLRVRRW